MREEREEELGGCACVCGGIEKILCAGVSVPKGKSLGLK